MPTPTTVDDFLSMVRKSGLVAADRLDAFAQGIKADLTLDVSRAAGHCVKQGLLTSFQAQQIIRGKYRNFTVGEYTILEPLAGDEASRSYLCAKRGNGQKVTMKLLPMQQGLDITSVERRVRAAQAATRIDHPGVARPHEVGHEAGKFFYIVTEPLADRTLTDLEQRDGPRSPAQAGDLARQLGDGLRAIHVAGLTHGSLNPDRITVVGTPRITGLGEGQLLSVLDSAATKYAAPEVKSGKPADVRSDLFSLGGVLYFALTGRTPGEAESTLARTRPDLPPSLAAAIDKLLHVNPSKRPASAAAFLQLLGDAAPPPPTEIKAPTPTPVLDIEPASSGNLPVPDAAEITPRSLARVSVEPPSEGLSPLAKWLLALSILVAAGLVAAFTMSRIGDPPGSVQSKATSDAKPAVTKAEPKAEVKLKETPPAEKVPEGAIVVSSNSRTPTLAMALATAKPGDRILIAERSHREALTIANPPVNISIESWPPDAPPVVWRPPADHSAAKPLIDISNARGLKLRGIHLEGAGQVRDLVQVRGNSAGLTIDDVRLATYGRSGLRFVNAAGAAAQPIRVNHVRVAVTSSVPTGIAFDAVPGGRCQHVQVKNSRFEGPLLAAISLAGTVNDLDITGNRFYRVHVAVKYLRQGAAPVAQFAFNSNTVASAKSGLHFESLPPPGSRFSAFNNLFVSTPRLATLDGVQPQPADAPPWIWGDDPLVDRKPSEGDPVGTMYFRKWFDVAGATPAATLDVGCVGPCRVWINGSLAGSIASRTDRVIAFDVADKVKRGRNVIAVEAENPADPFDPSAHPNAGLVVRLQARDRTLVATDATWRSKKTAGDNWFHPDFDDADWHGVATKPSADHDAVWDSEVARQLGDTRISFVARGNVCDLTGTDGYPGLDALRARVPALPTDANKDGEFLHYPAKSPLSCAGSEGGPVGAVE